MADKKQNKKKSGLGSGLESIFGENFNDVIEKINRGDNEDKFGYKTILPLNEIKPNPYQPRKQFDQAKIDELANSIQENGLLQPITVRKTTNGYQLIAGERRYRACQQLGFKEIEAIVRDFNDQQMMEFALLENIQREDINIIEEASGYEKMMQTFGYTQEQLAQRLSKSREHVANTLRLLKLPKDVQILVIEKKLSMGHVRPLITLEPQQISELANRIVEEGLSVRAVESLTNDYKNNKKVTKKTVKANPFIQDIENKLQQKFSSKVKIASHSIQIQYDNVDDLNRILEILDVIE